MNNHFTERAGAAVSRYAMFTENLRAQSQLALSRDPLDAGVRQEAVRNAFEAARTYANYEHAVINEDTQNVAVSAYQRARDDLGLATAQIDQRFADFIFTAAQYAARLVAAQADRDVVYIADNIRRQAQRVDLYVRSGQYTLSGATAQILADERRVPAFRFVDRLGRRFKSTKHIRDTYRQHLLNVYNEVYMDVLAEHGQNFAAIDHPDPNYAWAGEKVAIVPDQADEVPLIYDVRDEIFHPGSNATLTIWKDDDVPA